MNIKSLFTSKDVDHMIAASKGALNLWDYDSVKQWAPKILTAVSQGTMPPAPDGLWPQDKIACFKQWMDAGMPP
ncbi:MAG TPA: hypothetical protein VLC12_05240 [Terriglobales bacterium]|nr:hypothetical protein [Terriglobales bacterium]